MTITNSQTTELSLDQLDGINGGTIEKVRFRVGGGGQWGRAGRGKAQAEGGMTTKSRKSMRKIR